MNKSILASALLLLGGSLYAAGNPPPLVDNTWVKANGCKPGVAVLDVRSEKIDGQSKDDYLKGHIPCAVHTDYIKAGWRKKQKDIPGMLPPVDKLEELIGGLGIDNDELPQWLGSVPGLKDHVAYADSARPETISHVNQHEFPLVESCKKWQGSVEDGIQHLRGYRKITVHPRCKHTIDQFKLYSYKTDRLTGEVQPVLIKKHDDIPDAIRYALGPLIKVEPEPEVYVV